MSAHRNNWKTTVLLFALTSLVESLAFGHLGAFTPLYLRELKVPPGAIDHWTGILSSLAFVLGLPLLPFWGVLADRYGRKIIIIRSSFFAAVIYAVSAAAPNVYWLAFGRFLGGFVLGNTGVMMAVQADITPKERLGTAVSLISAGAPVGMAIGPIIGGALIRTSGVPALLWMDTVLTAIVVVCLAVFLKDEPREETPHVKAGKGAADALRCIVHTAPVLRLFGVIFLLAFGLSMIQPYAPLLIEALFKGPRQNLAPTIGWVMTAAGIGMALTTPIWGGLGDRLGHLRVIRICALTTCGSVALQAASHVIPMLAAGRLMQGMFQGGLGSLSMVLMAKYSPVERRSSILTLSLLPQQMAWFLGPLAASMAAGFGLSTVFWIGSLLVALGWAGSLALREA